ncbi:MULTISPECIES: helix-turn-helix domain-containing protein [Lysinibacillus]|uniref:helix-turn-helix domain-containing protein n=1 Tax=Lysinibacillus TaxID=400634 RepID=UPI0021A8E911|nr:helix-turn-helix domain-containing protein [Lysinibacillus capsici]MCT1539480.1 helix-turn-helix domain-containing protein [Lysinibacillus capsici]MCT1570453.1 helix-turn-helix domain-containing protein [Lysinibacillus capsici]MCT1647639.1 helix-turn-helix domain-containing protein [Lysinibacillus capsici]MCT1726082.1 helix-turn-helix domain-containing protein [Lysinibacillus capsici]MCT1783187.1 helix-turn-helix domain-containing protein [Lysinibacillus capsici]
MAFEYLAQYTTFESIADMDTAVENHMAAHYYDLTESERAIVFKLASHSLEYPGACHLKAATIAAPLEISTKTVYRAISKLESLGIIKKETTVKSKGGQGASIYIILPSQSETCEDPAEPIEGCVVVPLQEAYNLAHADREACKEFMNEYQQMLFDFMYSLPIPDNFKDDLYKVVLASNVSTIQEFIMAKNIIFKMANDIKEGVLTVTKTLRAVFVGAHNKVVQRIGKHPTTNTSYMKKKPENVRTVPFYNWLSERNGPTEVL